MRLLAWIEVVPDIAWTAYWVPNNDCDARPSRQLCLSSEQAHQRIERAARDLGVEIEWLAEGDF